LRKYTLRNLAVQELLISNQELQPTAYQKMWSEPSNEDLGLPSYNDVITGEHSERQNHHVRSSVQNEIHSELLNLAISFSSVQGDKLHQLQQNDERVLDLLIPHVKTFLAEYSETNLPMATLILIPAGIISPLAAPADDDLRSADDFGRVVTVSHEKGGDSPLWGSADMAERLASYLRPRPDELPPRPSQASSPPVEAASSKKSFFSRKRPAAEPTVPAVDVKSVDLPKVAMVVKAEEVVFRLESELGLYENQTVWGIVIRLRVNTGKQGY
jgi:hypothetical protein